MVRLFFMLVFGIVIQLCFINGQRIVNLDRSFSGDSFRRVSLDGTSRFSPEFRSNNVGRRNDVSSTIRLQNRGSGLTRAELLRLRREELLQRGSRASSRGSNLDASASLNRDAGSTSRRGGLSSNFNTRSSSSLTRDSLLTSSRRQSGTHTSRRITNDVISGLPDRILDRTRGTSDSNLANDINTLLMLLRRDERDTQSISRGTDVLGALRQDLSRSRSIRRTTGTDFNTEPQQRLPTSMGTNIVLLRGNNSRKPLNLQIGNTQFEVFGNSNPSDAQLVIQTQRENVQTVPNVGNVALASNIASIAADIQTGNINNPLNQLASINNAVPAAAASAAAAAATTVPVASVKTLQVVVTPTPNIAKPLNVNVTPAPVIVNTPKTIVSANILPTTPTPIVTAPVVNIPKTPTQALKEVLGPNFPAHLVSKMALEILPKELRHLESIMGSSPDAGVLSVGGQTSQFNVGSTKRITFTDTGNGTKATITSIHNPIRSFSHIRGVTEEPELEELLLKAVLKNMNG